jgi:hypothetical protein
MNGGSAQDPGKQGKGDQHQGHTKSLLLKGLGSGGNEIHTRRFAPDVFQQRSLLKEEGQKGQSDGPNAQRDGNYQWFEDQGYKPSI